MGVTITLGNFAKLVLSAFVPMRPASSLVPQELPHDTKLCREVWEKSKVCTKGHHFLTNCGKKFKSQLFFDCTFRIWDTENIGTPISDIWQVDLLYVFVDDPDLMEIYFPIALHTYMHVCASGASAPTSELCLSWVRSSQGSRLGNSLCHITRNYIHTLVYMDIAHTKRNSLDTYTGTNFKEWYLQMTNWMTFCK